MDSNSPPLRSAQQNRRGFIYRIGRFDFVHRAVAFFRIYALANYLLSKRNIMRQVPSRDGDFTVRIRSIAAMTLAEEIFDNESYRSALEGREFNTFVDLGCNAGWFAVYSAKMFAKRKFSGLMIDANPGMLEEARWHLQKNSIQGCETLLGAVGCEPGLKEVTFYVNPSDTQSSVAEFGEDHPFPVKGEVKLIRVPALVLAEEWTSRFAEAPIDLLKVDIEGAELSFLKNEIDFIQSRVRRIICEWHKWHVSFDDMNELLANHGFDLEAIAEEDDRSGVAVYLNRSSLPSSEI